MPVHFPAQLIGIGIAAACLLLSTAVPGKIVSRYDLYMATKSTTQSGKKYLRSEDHQFGCDDSIYLFLESSDQALAPLTMDTVWENLESGERHETSHTFAPQKGGDGFWSWSGITFRTRDNPLDLLTKFMDPATGREKFIGEWKISASVADHFNRELTMHVLC